MHPAIEICRIGISIRRSAIVILILTCCCLSCYDPADPPCVSEKDSFTATVTEGGMPSYLFSAGPCDIGFAKYINSIGGDSIVIDGIVSVADRFTIESEGEEVRSIAIGFNIISEGEYTFGVNSIPGEPSAESLYMDSTGPGVNPTYRTNPDGSGTVIIDSLSSDYISGTFQATLISGYIFGASRDSLRITSGSFSGHLVFSN